jgi:hypothetical protein
MDIIDKNYSLLLEQGRKVVAALIPHLRMVLRFLALPYAYFLLVNWNECKASRSQVLKDFIYIFFVLRDFPDYYSMWRLWEKDRKEWAYYYGSMYNPYQRGKLRRNLQKKEYEIVFEDKYITNQICTSTDLPVPRFLGYVEPGTLLAQMVPSLLERSATGKIIIKASRGRGGRDVFLVYKKDTEIVFSNNKEEIPLTRFNLEQPSIIQECLEQHSELNTISSSINTVRTETLLTRDNKVLFLGAFMRFGIDDMFLDNQCAGGLSIGVNLETGVLFDYAANGKGEKFFNHPNSNQPFKGFKVPFWSEILLLSEKIQRHFPYFKLLGPDIAITPEGPVIIEINATPDHAGLEMDYGPVLKNKEVWQAFQEYDLFINKPSRHLY